jgi:hypothetical protein
VFGSVLASISILNEAASELSDEGEASNPGAGKTRLTVTSKKVSKRDLQHLTIWLLCVVLVPIFGLVFVYLPGVDTRKTLSFHDLLGHGDLLIIGAVIVFAGISEIIRAGDHMDFTRKLLLVAGGVFALFEAGWYGSIAASGSDKSVTVDSGIISSSSIVCFLLSVVVGGSCVLIALAGSDES